METRVAELIKVLIVEDDKGLYKMWGKMFQKKMLGILDHKILILSALTIEEAEQLFSDNSDIRLIAIDGCVPGICLNTLPLTRAIRQRFVGPMIAISSRSDYREKLMKAGCDYECEKFLLPQKIFEILAL